MRQIATAIAALLIAANVWADGCGPLTTIFTPDGRQLTCQTCYGITTCY